ncbi:MAG: hypothetical protein AABY15_05680 [Nanoarchaeota archaeon]
MESNNINPNTGSKGVFPGANVSQPNQINQVAQPMQNNQITNNQILETQEESAADAKTYMHLETKNAEGQVSGIIEIDLISFRERGQESRYLSIKTAGAGSDGKRSDTALSIDNENDFNKFKKFISELNWND